MSDGGSDGGRPLGRDARESLAARRWLAQPISERMQKRYKHLMPADPRRVLRLLRRRYVPKPQPSVQEEVDFSWSPHSLQRSPSFVGGGGTGADGRAENEAPNLDAIRERQGLLKRTRCGLCEQVFNCAQLSSSATRRSIIELRATWGCTVPVDGASRPSRLYERMQLCIFCAQFFDHTPPCFDEAQVEEELARGTPAPTQPHTNTNQPATRFAPSPAPYVRRLELVPSQRTPEQRKMRVWRRVEQRVLELMGGGSHLADDDDEERRQRRRARRRRQQERDAALTALWQSESTIRAEIPSPAAQPTAPPAAAWDTQAAAPPEPLHCGSDAVSRPGSRRSTEAAADLPNAAEADASLAAATEEELAAFLRSMKEDSPRRWNSLVRSIQRESPQPAPRSATAADSASARTPDRKRNRQRRVKTKPIQSFADVISDPPLFLVEGLRGKPEKRRQRKP